MALDGITAQLLSTELDKKLRGGRIDKIFMPDKYTVILHIRSLGTVQKLLISIDPSSPHINLTETTRDNPSMPPSFCMLLRKYLSGSKIISITNPGCERLIEIKASTIDELHDTKQLTLVVELMGRYSNCILLNPENRILDAAMHVDYSVSRVREVMPARIYEYPPKQDKILPSEALELVKSGNLPVKKDEMNRPVSKALLNSIMGLSPLIARQLCFEADIDERMSVSSLESSDISKLLQVCGNFFESIINLTYEPHIYYSESGTVQDFAPFLFRGYRNSVKTDSISECIDRYYFEKDGAIDFNRKKSSIEAIVNNALTHVTHKAEVHKTEVSEGAKADEYKKYGDLILSYSYLIKDKTSEITVVDYYDENSGEITIEVDPSLTASDNAQLYYKRFRKAKNKYIMAQDYLKADMDAIEYLRSLKTMIASASNNDDLDALKEEINVEVSGFNKDKSPKKKNNVGKIDPNKTVGIAKSGKASSRALRKAAQNANQGKNKKKTSENTHNSNFRHYTSSDGHEIFCGRNNIQNDSLTFGHAQKNDWWFHIKGLPGTHVILKTKSNEEMPSDSSITEAAMLAAYFSKEMAIEEHAVSSEDLKIEVDYCPVSHVKKIPKAKPGMVIYEGYYSIYVTPKEFQNS